MRKPMKFIASSLLLVGFGLIGSSILFGRGKGVIEGEFQIPKNVTKAFPACGQAQCHGTGFPNERGVVKILIKTSASIQLGAKSPLTATLTGGVKNSTKGGFSMDTDLGTFTAGIGTRTGNSNQSITHNSSASRTWTFTFSSTKTGLAQLTMVGNTVDGNGRNSGDSWAWYGPNSNLPGTPFRIFVNDSKVLPYGSACAGTKEFAPLIGIRKNAALGQTTTVEAYNLPPAVPVMNILGFSNTSFGAIPLPLDLGFPTSAPSGASISISRPWSLTKGPTEPDSPPPWGSRPPSSRRPFETSSQSGRVEGSGWVTRTVVVIPPRTRKCPSSWSHRGSRAAMRSSAIRLQTAS